MTGVVKSRRRIRGLAGEPTVDDQDGCRNDNESEGERKLVLETSFLTT